MANLWNTTALQGPTRAARATETRWLSVTEPGTLPPTSPPLSLSLPLWPNVEPSDLH